MRACSDQRVLVVGGADDRSQRGNVTLECLSTDRGEPRPHAAAMVAQRPFDVDVSGLLEQYEIADFGRKVVGAGSVGTRSFIGLLLGRDGRDPLFLQAKEADASVLEEFVGASKLRTQGERVVAGQRVMQAASRTPSRTTATTTRSQRPPTRGGSRSSPACESPWARPLDAPLRAEHAQRVTAADLLGVHGSVAIGEASLQFGHLGHVGQPRKRRLDVAIEI